MQFDNQKTRNVADIAAKIMAGETVETEKKTEMISEELKGNQHKIDANKNGKVDADDFAKLRAQKEKANSQKFGKDVKEETEQVDEAMFPGTKEYQKKYGESPQQKLKKVGDKQKTSAGEMEKTEKGVKHTRKFTEMVAAYKEGGLKTISEMFLQEEPTNDEYKAEVEDMKAKAEGKKKQPDLAKGSVQAVQQEEADVVKEGIWRKDVERAFPASGVKTGASAPKGTSTMPKDPNKAKGQPAGRIGEEVEQIEEREMTDAEMKKREEIVKSMKKGMAGFKQRYGDRAKDVMYATATKQAMKD